MAGTAQSGSENETRKSPLNMAVRPGLPASLAPLAAIPERAEAAAALRVTIARRMATTVISAPFHLRRRMPTKICRHRKGDISK